MARLARQQRQRAWLWSRDYYPTRLLQLQGVPVPATHSQRLVLSSVYWWETSCLTFLEEVWTRYLEVTCRACWIVRGALYETIEADRAICEAIEADQSQITQGDDWASRRRVFERFSAYAARTQVEWL